MNIIQAIGYLFPAAVSGKDYTVDLTSQAITLWNNALGVQPTPAQLTAAWDAVQLAAAQTAQNAAIEQAFQVATYETPIPYLSTTFWTDSNSQFMLLGAAWGYGLAGAVPSGFSWWDSTGKAVAMTLTELQGLAQATLGMVNTNFQKRKALLAQIASATTVAAVQAVFW